MTIKVSIIIPAYNVEEYIEKSVRSAMAQTLQGIEIIVVNDGSPDNVQSIVEQLRSEDPRIILINKENGGISSARNVGIDIAKGEYIQYLDGDDWIEANACEVTYQLAKKENLDIVICDFYITENGKTEKRTNNTTHDNIFTGKHALLGLLTNNLFPCLWNKLIKKSLYQKIEHPTHISYGEDLATSPKLFYEASRVALLNEAFLHYEINDESLSSKGNKFEAILACQEIRAYLEGKNDFLQYKEAYHKLLESRLACIFVEDTEKQKTQAYKQAEQIVIQYYQEIEEIPPHIKFESIKITRKANGFLEYTFIPSND